VTVFLKKKEAAKDNKESMNNKTFSSELALLFPFPPWQSPVRGKVRRLKYHI
jgi:hypothetical protein